MSEFNHSEVQWREGNIVKSTFLGEIPGTEFHGTRTYIKYYSERKPGLFIRFVLQILAAQVHKNSLDQVFDINCIFCSDSVVSVHTSSDVIKDVMITGIDKYGFLVVRGKDGSTSSVQPDNNTFDMMQGLIAPKIR